MPPKSRSSGWATPTPTEGWKLGENASKLEFVVRLKSEKKSIKLDAVVSYDLPIDKIVSRLSGRRTCEKCKAVYHVETRPPRMPGW